MMGNGNEDQKKKKTYMMHTATFCKQTHEKQTGKEQNSISCSMIVYSKAGAATNIINL